MKSFTFLFGWWDERNVELFAAASIQSLIEKPAELVIGFPARQTHHSFLSHQPFTLLHFTSIIHELKNKVNWWWLLVFSLIKRELTSKDDEMKEMKAPEWSSAAVEGPPAHNQPN